MASPIASTSRTTLGSLLRRPITTTTTTNTLTTNSTPRASISARRFTSQADVQDSTSTDAPAPLNLTTDASGAPLDGTHPVAEAVVPTEPLSIPADTPVDPTEQRRLRRALMDQLAGLGSTQTRASSFRPHKQRLNPVDAHQLTLNHLVASTAQIGHSLSNLKIAQQPHIYGQRHGVAVFDLERATLPALRRAAAVVKGVAERDGVILFVGTRPGQQAAVLAATKRLAGNGFHVTAERWTAGVLTNAPKLLAPAILQSYDDLDPTGTENANRLASQTLKPDLVVILNPIENGFAIREATQAHIPTIAITDSDVDPRSVTYPIPANDDSIRTIELIIGVLSKAGEEGLRARAKKLDEADKIERKINRTLKRQVEDGKFDPRTRSDPTATQEASEADEFDENEVENANFDPRSRSAPVTAIRSDPYGNI